jgi:NADH dehydrogenase [ubiquinone] 1 alpha subcomplex assembly factor 7
MPTPLAKHLKQKIDIEGPLTLAVFLEEVLYHPQWGYYAHHNPIGKDGDYITAPEMTQVFGELLALWAYVQWQSKGRHQPVALIELGPGKGTLMQDFLRTLQKYPDFAESLHVYLLEKNPDLRRQQQEKLSPYQDKITWVDELEAIPPMPSLIFANEFFDALPFQQFIHKQGQWWERHITYEANDFVYQDYLTTFQVPVPIASQEEAQEEVIYEHCALGQLFAQKIAERLHQAPGHVLIIDYGYEEPAFGNTLQALRTHRYHPPLVDIGTADLTHHVNFTQLQQIFCHYSLQTHPIIAMGDFLKDLGIVQRTELLCQKATPEQSQLLLTAAARLISANHMGYLFKVLIAESKED